MNIPLIVVLKCHLSLNKLQRSDFPGFRDLMSVGATPLILWNQLQLYFTKKYNRAETNGPSHFPILCFIESKHKSVAVGINMIFKFKILSRMETRITLVRQSSLLRQVHYSSVSQTPLSNIATISCCGFCRWSKCVQAAKNEALNNSNSVDHRKKKSLQSPKYIYITHR